jgi:hypothetical protein
MRGDKTYSLERKLAGREVRMVSQDTIVRQVVKQFFNVEAKFHRTFKDVAQEFCRVDFLFLGELGRQRLFQLSEIFHPTQSVRRLRISSRHLQFTKSRCEVLFVEIVTKRYIYLFEICSQVVKRNGPPSCKIDRQ